jgi:hypothetical protein
MIYFVYSADGYWLKLAKVGKSWQKLAKVGKICLATLCFSSASQGIKRGIICASNRFEIVNSFKSMGHLMRGLFDGQVAHQLESIIVK